ncbi:MAG: hypothetical protein ACU841_08130 [Gammaproteobacteria bacterium]
MFKLLGILVALYTFQSIHKGEVFAKSGLWGRTVSKSNSPGYFWLVIAIYAGLSAALLTVF